MEVITVPIESIKPYENNPRNNDGAVKSVAESISQFGWQQPIVVDKDMTVIVGHTRLKAAQQLGMKDVPIHVADNLTPEQVKAYRLLDNKLAEIAYWKIDALREELSNLDFDFTPFDIDFTMHTGDIPGLSEMFNESPELPESRGEDSFDILVKCENEDNRSAVLQMFEGQEGIKMESL